MTVVEKWTTDRVPAEARLDAWADKMGNSHLRWEMTASPDRACEAALRYRSTGDISVADFQGAGFAGTRQPDHDTEDLIGLQLNVGGSESLKYGDEDFNLPAETLFVWSSGLGRSFNSFEEHREVTVMVPRWRAPRPLSDWLDSSRPLTTSAGGGLVSIVGDHMRGIAREMDTLSDHALLMSVDVLLETLCAAVQPTMTSSRTERSALFERIQQFVADNLDDPTMSVTSIAAHHNISTRTLQTLFSEAGTSAGRFVRQQRLEQCRRELTRATGGLTVTDIAFRWGFVDAAHFSRSFKDAFGVTPSSFLVKR